MRLWFRYLREKRSTVLLYFLTVFLFLAVGSLYHMENLDMLLYATLLTFVVLVGIGLLQGFRYVRRSRRLEAACRHFEQSGDFLPRGYEEEGLEGAEEGVEDAEDYAQAYTIFLSLICESKEKERRKWEEKAAERNDYYMMWTHQIKTPISALKLLLEESGLQGRSGFLMREELFKIEQYVEMVLTFQRLESIASDMVLQEYDLYALLKRAVKKYAVLFINKGLSLELQETDLRVVTDEKWFVFCVEQLLSNSIKYTQEGGIHFHAEAAGEKVELVLEDTGIGIRPEDLPRIFEKGFTGYNGRLDRKSTGIGLYLCRRIFALLSISVKVESEEGAGTRVTLGVPGALKLSKL